MANKYSKVDSNVLIIGETGTEKSYLLTVFINQAIEAKNHLLQ